MKDASVWEKSFLGAAVVFFAGGLVLAVRAGEDLHWNRPILFLPSGLLALTAANVRLRSKFLAWGVFSLSFILFMAVLGSWTVVFRAAGAGESSKFLRVMALYLFLAVAALFQLRAARIVVKNT